MPSKPNVSSSSPPRKRSSAEGDGDLDEVALLRDPPRARPEDVPLPVLAPGTVQGLGLDTEGVDAELEGAPLVVEGVEHEADVIILHQGVDLVTVHQVCPDTPGLGVVCPEAHVEVLLVEGHETLGLDGRFGVLPR